MDCPGVTVGSTPRYCDHVNDVGVRCIPPTSCIIGDIRLQGGSTASEGRVEVCQLNIWGGICSDFWEAVDAQVACRQLGYPVTEDAG